MYRVLGKGYFGEVREGRWATSIGERKIAVKALIPGRMSMDKFLAEADVMKKMQHPNVLRILGSFWQFTCVLCNELLALKYGL